MSLETAKLLLTISGSLIVILGSVVWWGIREKFKERNRKEETLEKRLNAGSEALAKLGAKIETLITVQIKHEERMNHELVAKETFDTHKELNTKEHTKLQNTMQDVTQAMTRLEQRLDTGLTSMTNLLSKYIDVGAPSKPREDRCQ